MRRGAKRSERALRSGHGGGSSAGGGGGGGGGGDGGGNGGGGGGGLARDGPSLIIDGGSLRHALSRADATDLLYELGSRCASVLVAVRRRSRRRRWRGVVQTGGPLLAGAKVATSGSDDGS